MGDLLHVRDYRLHLFNDLFSLSSEVDTMIKLESCVIFWQISFRQVQGTVSERNDSRECGRSWVGKQVFGHSPARYATGAKDQGHVLLKGSHVDQNVKCNI